MPKFACPHCGQHIDADESWSGQGLSCPTCAGQLIVPGVSPESVEFQPTAKVAAAPAPNAGETWGWISVGGSSALAAVLLVNTTSLTTEIGSSLAVKAGVVFLLLLVSIIFATIVSSGCAILGAVLKARKGVKHVFCMTFAFAVIGTTLLQVAAAAFRLAHPPVEIKEDWTLAEMWEQPCAHEADVNLVSWVSEPIGSLGNRRLMLKHPRTWETRKGIRPMVVQRFVTTGRGMESVEVIAKPMPRWVVNLSAPRLKDLYSSEDYRAALAQMGVYQLRFAPLRHGARHGFLTKSLFEDVVLGHGASLELMVFEEDAIVGYRVAVFGKRINTVEEEITRLWPSFVAVGKTLQIAPEEVLAP